ncbi:Nicotinate-nucleotide pyrophosphorylase [Golovinomyces cichoracearum]|uniref:Nicotinate-nucleotide pyrophosphorylase [carboxylating] n=1 Tax=Golovinomyces cichoracearum TaxID=62708 RepID=A0A420J6H4_9PEZI|nr:Nicotinate-nucleotide pyrophosphorylase [Golovinomyces cichoracearum]
MLSHHGNLADLLPLNWKNVVSSWFQEDTPSFDYGGFVVGNDERTATLYAKSNGVLAGMPFFNEIFAQADCTVRWYVEEGSWVEGGASGKTAIASITGPVRKILLGERVALNTLSRCSGVATQSKKMLDLVHQAGYTGILAGTRKTTPGFRLVEKYGMMVGGIDGHRHDLSSMIMLKDNHIWAKGSIKNAVQAAQKAGGFSLKVEVEVGNRADAHEAIEAGADIIMLDNFNGDELKVLAVDLKREWAGKRNFLLECSGGLTTENVASFITNKLISFLRVLSTKGYLMWTFP